MGLLLMFECGMRAINRYIVGCKYRAGRNIVRFCSKLIDT